MGKGVIMPRASKKKETKEILKKNELAGFGRISKKGDKFYISIPEDVMLFAGDTIICNEDYLTKTLDGDEDFVIFNVIRERK